MPEREQVKIVIISSADIEDTLVPMLRNAVSRRGRSVNAVIGAAGEPPAPNATATA